VKVYGAVPPAPVNMTLGEVTFLHTVVPPAIVAVGKGFTVTVALPLWAWLQAVDEASFTLTNPVLKRANLTRRRV